MVLLFYQKEEEDMEIRLAKKQDMEQIIGTGFPGDCPAKMNI